jgi:organic radical activating enzyme
LEDRGYLDEIFCSIQGEGIYLGYRQVFIRTGGCGARCLYCDTRRAAERREQFTLHTGDGKELLDNPVEPAEAALAALRLSRICRGVHSVSITGGEPLEQPRFVLEMARVLREEKLPVYLETNGLHAGILGEIKPFLDIVSLDIKQPALCGLESDIFSHYRSVLSRILPVKVFCKIVLCDRFEPAEFEESVAVISRVSRSIPLVIQPASAGVENQSYQVPDTESLMDCYSVASRYLDDVRIIPQCHRILGIR